MATVGFKGLMLMLMPAALCWCAMIDLGRRISHISGEDREVLFLFHVKQRLGHDSPRFNTVLLQDSFPVDRPGH